MRAAAVRGARDLRYNQVGPDYLETIGTRLLHGRFFGPGDALSPSRTVVVSRALAELYFGRRDPIGRRLRVDDDEREIVGVVEDVRISALHEPAEPFLYLPFASAPSRDVALVVEANPAQDGLPRTLSRIVDEAGAGTVVLDSFSMGEHMAAQLYPDWMPALVGAGLSGVGILLALAGLYAAVALAAQRRTREFGVRMAIGASPTEVLRLVVRESLRLTLAGAALGLLLAFGATRLLSSSIYGVGSGSTIVLAGSVLSALALSGAASVVPAWRATRIEPATTLRHE